jgi:hypothetical protein
LGGCVARQHEELCVWIPKRKISQNIPVDPKLCFSSVDAANDAHCALMAYNKIMAIAKEEKVTLNATVYTSSITEDSMVHPPSTRSTPASAPTATTTTITQTSSPSVVDDLPLPAQVRIPRQHSRAYQLWHHQDMSLENLCANLRSQDNPLKEGTVMSAPFPYAKHQTLTY